MGKQYNKTEKRSRRTAYLKRKSAAAKLKKAGRTTKAGKATKAAKS